MHYWRSRMEIPSGKALCLISVPSEPTHLESNAGKWMSEDTPVIHRRFQRRERVLCVTAEECWLGEPAASPCRGWGYRAVPAVSPGLPARPGLPALGQRGGQGLPAPARQSSDAARMNAGGEIQPCSGVTPGACSSVSLGRGEAPCGFALALCSSSCRCPAVPSCRMSRPAGLVRPATAQMDLFGLCIPEQGSAQGAGVPRDVLSINSPRSEKPPMPPVKP